MDVNVRRELQGYVSEFVGGGDEDAVRELVKIVSKSEGPYECIAIFDSVLYKLRTKRVREKLRAIKLLSTLSSASQRFALVVAEGVQSITKWTVLEAGVSQEVRKETEEFLTEWYVLYSSSPAVRRASRHLAVRAGIPLQTRIHDEREDVVSIDGIVEQIREIVAEMESCFDILVPRFAEVSEGTEGIHLVDFSAYKALDAEGVPRDDDQDVVDGTENLDESGEEVDIEIDIGATAGRSEDMQPIISNLQDRLRALTRKETVLSSVREESTTEKKRLVDATIAKIVEIREKAIRFGVTENEDDIEWEDVDVPDAAEAAEESAAVVTPLADRIGNIHSVDDINNVVLAAAGAALPGRGAFKKSGGRGVQKRRKQLSPKSRIRAKLRDIRSMQR